MRMKIEPSVLVGEIKAICSKSVAHRMLICGALSDSPTDLWLPNSSADLLATMDGLIHMGAKIERDQGFCRISSLKPGRKGVVVHCGESGSTLRFLLPVAAAVCGDAFFDGQGRLASRPVASLVRALQAHGAVASDLHLPLLIHGGLQSGTYDVDGNISSQYISGLLFALPLLAGDSRIHVTTVMESAPYVDMTVEVLEQFGVCIRREGSDFLVPGKQRYGAREPIFVEGDWSAAAFFLTCAALGGNVAYSGLCLDSVQGDKEILRVLSHMGARISVKKRPASLGGDLVFAASGKLVGMDIDVRQIPDLVPVLAVAACSAEGRTVFEHAGRLRLKESDRLESTAALINALGGRAEAKGDCLTVHGTGGLVGGQVCCLDHRIAMAAAVAACVCRKPVIIEGAESVEKSYPDFFLDYNRLGGLAYVI